MIRPRKMSARFAAVTETQRVILETVDRLDPEERDAFYTSLVGDLRARRPESVSPLTLGPPSDPAAIKDPRGER